MLPNGGGDAKKKMAKDGTFGGKGIHEQNYKPIRRR
jgi:hypothetical protein